MTKFDAGVTAYISVLSNTLADRDAVVAHESKRVSSLESALEQAEKELARNTAALELLRLCQNSRISVKKHVESIVSPILKETFSSAYSFSLITVEDGEGGIEGLRMVCGEMGGIFPPSKLGGGGENVIQTSLRLALLMLDGSKRGFLILDEPGSNLDEDRWPIFLQELRAICKRAEIQLWYITHTPNAEDRTLTVVRPYTKATIVDSNESKRSSKRQKG